MIGFRLCLEHDAWESLTPPTGEAGFFLALIVPGPRQTGAQSTRKWTRLWAELKPVGACWAGPLLHTQQITNSVIAQEA